MKKSNLKKDPERTINRELARAFGITAKKLAYVMGLAESTVWSYWSGHKGGYATSDRHAAFMAGLKNAVPVMRWVDFEQYKKFLEKKANG